MARYISTTLPKLTKTYKLYGTAGTYTFTTPTKVTSLDVAVWGGGGFACGYSSNWSYGGSGGGFACGTIGTFPGKQWTVTIGDSGGTSSFGTALSATGGSSYCTPGTGCICTTAEVTNCKTASGGCSGCDYWGNGNYIGRGGGASGSPYGTGGNGGSGCTSYGGGGGGGWGLGHGGPGNSYRGGGGGGAGVAASGPGGAGTGGDAVYVSYCGGCSVNFWYDGGPGLDGLGGKYNVCNQTLASLPSAGREATDNNPQLPFFRLDCLTGGGGAGGFYTNGACWTVRNSTSGINGANGGGGGGAVNTSYSSNPHNGGRGGFGAGGGGGANGSYQGSPGGFGGGGGASSCAPGGCGGGAGNWSNSTGCTSGGQGAVLIVYER